MNNVMKNKIDELRAYRTLAVDIIQELEEAEEFREKLNIIAGIENLREMDNDPEFAEYKEYKEVKAVFKKLYILAAKTIINILTTEGLFSTDSAHSFNLTDPIEQMLAAEYIKLLPNAFIGGPMKAAASSPFRQVHKIIIEHYDNLPGETKYTEIFPSNFPQIIRKLKRNQV